MSWGNAVYGYDKAEEGTSQQGIAKSKLPLLIPNLEEAVLMVKKRFSQCLRPAQRFHVLIFNSVELYFQLHRNL